MAYYRCREAFVTRIGGARVSVHIGDLVEDDEDVFKVRPAAFEPVEEYMAARRARRAVGPGRAGGGVEQASAAPGEKRALTPPDRSRRGRAAGSKGKTQEGSKS